MTAPRRPAPGDEDPTRTVRLAQDPDRTVRLGQDADRTARPGPPDEADDATFLDPTAWATPDATQPVPAPQSVPAPLQDEPSQDERPLAEGEFRRFGPGVPPAAAAVWHGGAEPERPRRRRRRLLLLLLLLAVLGLFGWRWYTPALAVTAVTAGTDPAGPSCGGAAVITATVTTNGRAGTVRYRWLRSDGTSSGELTQSVPAGSRQADLVLRWTFDGHGTLPATATVEILAPARHSAAATFTYSCP
ncbi:hypothetical protein [Kitasatospora sp. NPDC057223]|uniref:hypothetical protein n=1 Tax=Kitasatospora sp. NPDC057223 TaxID=3346055 RepID=UPI00362F991D